MKFSLRRHISPALRAKIWAVFVLLGFISLAVALVLVALSTLVLSPSNYETVRSFNPFGIAMAGISALLIGYYWLRLGFRRAFRTLSLRDRETTDRIQALVFKKGKTEPLLPLVALGGGTGLSSLLKGIKELPIQLTAVVTVTDDGGSSGRLRQDLQILPPGDIRNCLVALSASESLLSKLFQFRFDEAGQMSGHSFGNLFIAAMTNLLGDFSSAVREASNILAIKGHVIPVTCDQVQLAAHFDDSTEVVGETAITGAGKRIETISLVPESPMANPEAISAIDDARLVIMGPGSLFTSVIPNLLVPGIAQHINECRAKVVYICNVMTQNGETHNFSALDHVNAILQKTPLRKIDIVIVNSRRAARPLMKKYEDQGQFWVPPTVTKIEELGIRVISGDFLLDSDLLRHNPTSLAAVIGALLAEEAVAGAGQTLSEK